MTDARRAFGVIAPHPPIMVAGVGGPRAEVTRASLDALALAGGALERFAPETVVLMSPHAPAVADAFAIDDDDALSGSLSQFGDPVRTDYPGDPELAMALLANLAEQGVPALSRRDSPQLHPTILDHGSIVPLTLLGVSRQTRLVTISLSFLPYEMHRTLGACVGTAAESIGRRVAFIASGDLSHRLTKDAPAGYSPQAHLLDEAIVELVGRGRLSELPGIDPDIVEAGGECGLRSFITLGGFLGDDPVPARVLAYEGPWGVGYLTALAGEAALEAYDAVAETSLSGRRGGSAGDDESAIVALARDAISTWVRSGSLLSDPSLSDPELPARAGAFVSLHLDGNLRGCIGTVLPTKDTLAEEVVANAIEAAARDPRFPPVAEAELERLEVKVDVLYPPETCSIGDLDPKQYGVVVSSGWRRGLLLPDLDGVEDVRQQIEIAMQKAGIQRGEPCGYERFRVDRYT